MTDTAKVIPVVSFVVMWMGGRVTGCRNWVCEGLDGIKD